MTKQIRRIPSQELYLTGMAEHYGGYCYNNEILLIRVTDFNKERLSKAASGLVSNSYKLDALMAVFVIEGDLDVSIDYNHYAVPEKSLLLISSMYSITGADISMGGRFFFLIAKREILDRLSDASSPKPVITDEFSDVLQTPLFKMDDIEFKRLGRSFENLYQYLKDSRDNLKEYLIKHSLTLTLIEIFSLMTEKREISFQKHFSRRKDIMTKFLFLLREFGEKEHNPAFYADRLFVSVQYLSLILKEETGKTASKHIAQYLATRARNILRGQNSSIKETAERLNFADQSSFGKFFKKETGITPKKYIESL